ncbi:MAG: ATP-binding protein [Candidatus Anammoxibacter sp.]
MKNPIKSRTALTAKQKESLGRTVKFSISFKILTGMILVILFVSTGIIYFSMLSIRAAILREVETRGIAAVKHLAFEAKYGVYTEDKSALSYVITGRLDTPDTVYVRIAGEDGSVLAEGVRAGYDHTIAGIGLRTEFDDGIYKLTFVTNSGERLCEFNAPIIMTEQSVNLDEDVLDEILLYSDDTPGNEGLSLIRGSVSIGISLKHTEKKLDEIFFINVFITFAISVIAISVSFFLIRVFVYPIKDMAQAAIEISEGDLTKFIEVRSTDEIGVMAFNFNIMTAGLRTTINELEELKEGLESKVRERTSDLNIAIKDLENANSNLKTLGALQTDFISVISHEFRTPLTSIIGFAKLMIKSIMNDIMPKLANLDMGSTEDAALKMEISEALEGAEIIVKEGNRLARLVNNVLDVSKMEAGAVDWNDEECSLAEIINSVMNTSSGLLEKAQEKDVRVHVEMDGDVPLVFCDKDKLFEVVLNLLHNAVKFTNHGTITWRVQSKNGKVETSVTDTGVGIAKQDMSQVFEKFKQVGRTLSGRQAGTGLGLVICKEIVVHYGGSIWVESELGKGSSFIFTIPISK